MEAEAAGGVVLLAAAVVALVWANSPWDAAYDELWATVVTIDVGSWSVRDDLRHWVNDGLMAIFFFVVGLEIKREVVSGELRDPRTAAVPALAALGGVVVPAVIYLAITSGTEGSDGWGIPMATDIAFAVGVVALFGPRVPSSLKLFLLTLAVVDDIAAIVVIAIFYTSDLDVVALGAAVVLLGVMTAARAANVGNSALYLVLGIGVWLATYESGVHATIAGVALGLLTPARPVAPAALANEWQRELSEEPTSEELRVLSAAAGAGISVAERLQHVLHPATSFVIVPLFALANAGVVIESGALGGATTTRVAVGVVMGLVIGKVVGIVGATWVAVRSGLGTLPAESSWPQLTGVAALAGIGFTVSLFITGLAFETPSIESAAKLGVLAASLIAAAAGSVVLLTAARASSSEPLSPRAGSRPAAR